MADSKTEKKIQVVPCPFCIEDALRYVVRWGNAYVEIGMPTQSHWCGTEAEAQAKAAELRKSEEFSGLCDNAFKKVFPEAAAAQPTETRPPLDTEEAFEERAEMSRKRSLEMPCSTCNGTGKVARAAAPVEPAPRPQEGYKCLTCGLYFGSRPDLESHTHAAAASSPVARPQRDEAQEEFDDMMHEGFSKAAARVEQPTPLTNCIHCGQYPFKLTAPAAPAVAQREKLQIVLDAAQEVVSTFGTNENYYKVRALQFALNAYEQRTEGQ